MWVRNKVFFFFLVLVVAVQNLSRTFNQIASDAASWSMVGLKDLKLPFALVTAYRKLYFDLTGKQNQGVTAEQ